ncbi:MULTISPECIES: hypothetical protein [unclassified Streptomyces]|uniref:hypothetical protein n=1 Tax=unclassified Streptomyces TaxID=2593676 RepID=UPI002E2D8803|nr:hypothetical protein [Streptomyces sp. NBC_00223]
MDVNIARGRRRRTAAVLTALVAILLLAGPAAADEPGPAPQSARLADFLRHDPVYVTDQLPRTVPRSTASRFAALAKRTGVPTYVLVLPDQGVPGGTLLGAVHDRLGRDGLYVLVGAIGVVDARAFGVRAPAEDAKAVALYALPYDAGPVRAFQEFVDAVAGGAEKAAARADALRKKYGYSGDGPAAFYPSSTDRENQSFLTGILLLGTPLLLLLVSPYVRRRRARPRADTGKVPPRPPLLRPVEIGAAVVLAAVIAVGAPRVFDQKLDSAAPVPTRADLTTRVDRVAAGLARTDIYTDPESPQRLDAARVAELGGRIAAFAPGPVRIAVVPQLSDDESAGDTGAFVTALHHRLGEDGVYVIADPLTGSVDLFGYGVRLDDSRLTFGLPAAIRDDDTSHPADDRRLGARLDDLMTYLKSVPTAQTPAQGPRTAPEALDDHRLPALYSGDFWPGLLIGALAAGVLWGLLAAVLGCAALVGNGRRRAREPGHAPPDPGLGRLRRGAQHELDTLGARFAEATPDEATRLRVWDCLDTAMLLVDRGPDGRPGEAVTAADLAAAIVLAQAGLAALSGHGYEDCCGLNPLHGPATARRDVGSVRREHVCASCRSEIRRAPGQADALRLVLPGPGGGAIPYEKAAGPLPAVRDGITRLITATRENARVQ